MALPGTVERVNLKFGPYWDGQGNPLKATLAARRTIGLTHLPTGGVILPLTESAGTDGAVEGSLLVVATDATGITPQNFTYDLTITFDSSTGVTPIVRRGVALPKGAPNVDVDLLVNGEISGGTPDWGPGVISVNGQTGIVTIAASGGDGGGGGGVTLPTGGTAGQLLRKNSVLEGDALWSDPAVTALQITDATTTGRAVLKAATAAAALAAIGAAAASHTHTSANITDFNTAVDARVAVRVGAAPAALDTLDELAAALGDDANFAATMTSQLALKAPLANPNFTGIPKVNGVPIPTNLVSADVPSLTIITDPTVDPSTAAADEVVILDSDALVTKPAINPSIESLRTVLPNGSLATRPYLPRRFYNGASGRHLLADNITATSSVALVSGKVILLPLSIGREPVAVDGLSYSVGTAPVGGTFTSFIGLYADDGTGGMPDFTKRLARVAAPLTALGLQTAAWTGTLQGNYWLAFVYNATVAPTTAPAVQCISTIGFPLPSGSPGSPCRGYSVNGTDLPTTAGQTINYESTLAAGLVSMGVRVA